ncbi:MAG TPA: response regulator transcription factor [Dehalococcoidia bacterium]|jgi:DNA-binding response OmpR family regulator|nr:response regulator transcription factor [Dehalococcoidia bacterium]
MKILLVEDDRRLARAVVAMFEEEEHTVDVAHDGERGLELGLAQQYDAIVLDLMLPHMDGFEVCRNLRTNNVETPILMLTARTGVDDRVHGLDSGADDYLPKPFAFNELMARLRALTRRQIDSRTADRLSVDGLELDLRRRRAEYKGKTMELSPTEFSLLEALMRNEGRVLSQSQILDHVWGYDSWPESNLVAVYVTYLRRKFKQLNIPVQIKAIRGVGYVLGQ